MKIPFHGATQTVTGSKHLISLKNGYNLLLDCGMYQGLGKETILLNSTLGFHPSEIHEVILSHAHIDHTGLLPKLVKNGFNGKIRGSAATLDLTEILLKDSACIQEADAKFVNKKRFQQGRPLIEPLYTLEDVNATTALFEALPVGKPVRLHQDVEITLYDIGHIFGATAIYLTVKEAGKTIRLAFTGDVGRYSDPLLKPPAPLPQADYLIIEST
jgi:metallo-beta-lactamase family protein